MAIQGNLYGKGSDGKARLLEVDDNGLLRVTGGGSGGGSGGASITDTLFTDDIGVAFIYRDNGATPPVFSAYRIPQGAPYVPGANPRPYQAVGVALENGHIASVDAAIGAQADVPAISDTSSASVIAILKRALQGLTGIFGKLPVIGRQVGAASLSVVPNTDVPFPVATSAFTITQSAFPVTAASQLMIAANPLRKYLAWMVIGSQDVTISPANNVAIGSGMVYQGSGANKQGASEEFPNGAPSNAFYAIAAAAGSSAVIIWEGV